MSVSFGMLSHSYLKYIDQYLVSPTKAFLTCYSFYFQHSLLILSLLFNLSVITHLFFYAIFSISAFSTSSYFKLPDNSKICHLIWISSLLCLFKLFLSYSMPCNFVVVVQDMMYLIIEIKINKPYYDKLFIWVVVILYLLFALVVGVSGFGLL